jgi:hypothetical protein
MQIMNNKLETEKETKEKVNVKILKLAIKNKELKKRMAEWIALGAEEERRGME